MDASSQSMESLGRKHPKEFSVYVGHLAWLPPVLVTMLPYEAVCIMSPLYGGDPGLLRLHNLPTAMGYPGSV